MDLPEVGCMAAANAIAPEYPDLVMPECSPIKAFEGKLCRASIEYAQEWIPANYLRE